MNILYVDHYAGSLDMGMEFRPYYLAREWQKLGHKVRIVGASFSHLRVAQPAVNHDFEIQSIDGIEYQWIKTVTYDKNGSARAISMFQFCGKLWLNAKKIVDEFQPDVVIGSSTYTFDTYPCQKIAKLAKAKYIHENHDLWPLTLTTIGKMSKYHPFCLLNEAGLKSALKNANNVVGVLPYAYEYFQEFGFKNLGKFTYIPNGVAKDDWENPKPLPKEHEELFENLEGKFIVLYIGGHALSNALDILIDTAEMFKDEKQVAFVSVGKGVDKNKLIEYAKDKNCDNFHFLPPVSKSVVPSVLKRGNLLYVGGEKSPLMQYGFGINKLYDYMLSGKPILYAIDSRNYEVLDAGCGFVCKNKDYEAMADIIRQTMNLPQDRLEQMSANGKKWVLENCEYSALAHKFLAVIANC